MSSPVHVRVQGMSQILFDDDLTSVCLLTYYADIWRSVFSLSFFQYNYTCICKHATLVIDTSIY